MMTKTGTVAFSAPEIFVEKYYDEKVDIWSAGIVLYMLLSGEQPFNSDNVAKLVHMITTQEITFNQESWQEVSENAKSLIKKMLNKYPEDRPSAEECLKEDWFEFQDFMPNLLEEQPFDNPQR